MTDFPIQKGKPKPKVAGKSARQTKRKGREVTDWVAVRGLVMDRSNGLCEGSTPDCLTGPHRGAEMHHVIRRSQGGPDEAWNLLNLCAPAHRWVHANPAKSFELGLLRRGAA